MAFEKAPIVEKTNLIFNAFHKHDVRSFLDLGGCWGVNGAYTFHSLLAFDIERAVIIDSDITEKVEERAQAFPQLELLRGYFGDTKIIERMGSVDAIIMYDVLLHQVGPDWDQIIALLAPYTDLFVIYNQMWTGSKNTIRLFDLGMEEYEANTPYGSGMEYLKGRIDQLRSNWDRVDPETGRKFQDAHNFWQWGIVAPDLTRLMWSLGFKTEFMENYGPYYNLKYFENNAFVFSRMNDILH